MINICNFGAIPSVTADELLEMLKNQSVNVIDIREHNEVMNGMIPSALHIPNGELATSLNDLDKANPLYLICHSGARGMRATEFLRSEGFDAYNVSDGMMGWAGDIT